MKKSGATKKENQFFFRNGSKLHTYGRDKAPYPLSYDREVFDLYVLMFLDVIMASALTYSLPADNAWTIYSCSRSGKQLRPSTSKVALQSVAWT